MCSYDGVNRVWNTSPVTLSIAAAATERACTSSPTLVRSVNTGASHHCRKDRAGDSLLGNPRTWVSEAPARNPQLNAGGDAYRLAAWGRQCVGIGEIAGADEIHIHGQ